jgi:hypothetical protein
LKVNGRENNVLIYIKTNYKKMFYLIIEKQLLCSGTVDEDIGTECPSPTTNVSQEELKANK